MFGRAEESVNIIELEGRIYPGQIIEPEDCMDAGMRNFWGRNGIILLRHALRGEVEEIKTLFSTCIDFLPVDITFREEHFLVALRRSGEFEIYYARGDFGGIGAEKINYGRDRAMFQRNHLALVVDLHTHPSREACQSLGHQIGQQKFSEQDRSSLQRFSYQLPRITIGYAIILCAGGGEILIERREPQPFGWNCRLPGEMIS